MPNAFLVLILFQLIGSAVQNSLSLPVPGPVIGMFLLAAALLLRKRYRPASAPVVGPELSRLAKALIAALGLLFVPAGVGLITQMPLLRANALPIVVALLGSTLLGLLVTGWVMHVAIARKG